MLSGGRDGLTLSVCVGLSLPPPTPTLPTPHWLKALSTGRAGKHAPGFSSFDWRKVDFFFFKPKDFCKGVVTPKYRQSSSDCQSGDPETQGEEEASIGSVMCK